MFAGRFYNWRWVCFLRPLPLQRTQRPTGPAAHRKAVSWVAVLGGRTTQTADRVRISRGTACVHRHQKYPPGRHGVPEITKNDSRTEIKTYPIAYTHQGVSGGGARIFIAHRPCSKGESHLLSEKRPDLVTQAHTHTHTPPALAASSTRRGRPGGRGARARVPGLAGGIQSRFGRVMSYEL
jgi:hypothetical protein